jgi:hypothetical protein
VKEMPRAYAVLFLSVVERGYDSFISTSKMITNAAAYDFQLVYNNSIGYVRETLQDKIRNEAIREEIEVGKTSDR